MNLNRLQCWGWAMIKVPLSFNRSVGQNSHLNHSSGSGTAVNSVPSLKRGFLQLFPSLPASSLCVCSFKTWGNTARHQLAACGFVAESQLKPQACTEFSFQVPESTTSGLGRFHKGGLLRVYRYPQKHPHIVFQCRSMSKCRGYNCKIFGNML